MIGQCKADLHDRMFLDPKVIILGLARRLSAVRFSIVIGTEDTQHLIVFMFVNS